MTKFEPLLVLGGTFDPIHLGHIHIAREVMREVGVSTITFIPCFQSPLRATTVTSPEERLQMVRLAAREFPFMQVDAREIVRGGKSYMVDTLAELATEQNDQVALCLILGIDAVAEFKKWHRWQEILQLAHLIVVNRPGYLLVADGAVHELIEQHQAIQAAELYTTKSGKILQLEIEPMPISATEIRVMLKNNCEIAEYIPEEVAKYVKAHDLYK